MRFQKLVNRQREFFLEGTTRSYEFRRSQLKLLRELVAKNRENIAAAIFKDLRRPYPVALITEADSTLEEIDYVLENFKRWMQPEEKRDEPYGQVAVLKEPLGVVLIVGPYNFPITLALRPLIVAMAAGNCAVVKPSELAVHSSRFLFELIARNFNNDYVAVVEGGVPETTRLLDQHFDHIFYTGSSRNGRLVMAAAAHHLTPVTLELGGKCPAVFADECDVKKSVDALCAGKFMNLGQTCMAPDYIVCVRDVKEGFVRAARSWLKENFTEHPKKSPAYGRLINRMHCNRLLNLLERSHGKVVYKAADEPDLDDHFVGPYLVEVEPEDSLMEEEIFGPLLPIITVDSLSEAVQFINRRERPLTAYIFTEDQKEADHFVHSVLCGNVVVNDVIVHYYSLQLPFGGVGQSGMGKYHGRYGFDSLTHEKAVVKNFFRG